MGLSNSITLRFRVPLLGEAQGKCIADIQARVQGSGLRLASVAKPILNIQ